MTSERTHMRLDQARKNQGLDHPCEEVMTYRTGEADWGSLILKSLLFVFAVGVFCGGVAFAIYALGEVFRPIGIHW